MKTFRILGILSLILVVAGFCLPWLEFYGLISGLQAVYIGFTNIFLGGGLHLLDSIVLFALIPLLSALAVWRIFRPDEYSVYPLIYILLIDLTVLFALKMISGFVSLRHIYPGFYIMLTGVLLINALTLSLFTQRRKLAQLH